MDRAPRRVAAPSPALATAGGVIDILGRLALAWVFTRNGIDVLRNPAPRVAMARQFLEGVRGARPVPLPSDVDLVRVNAATQVVAGAAVGLGVAPRAAAAALVASLVPTTQAGHPFWRFEDPVQRLGQRIHFDKNIGLAGGLLVVISSRPTSRG